MARGFEIPRREWPAAVPAVLSALQGACETQIGFGQERLARRTIRFAIQPGTVLEVGRRSYRGVRWFDEYMLSAELAVCPGNKGGYALESFSLIIVKGVLAYGDFTPLLRVEWEHQDEADVGTHAQPHWHVYSSNVIKPVGGFSLSRDKPGPWKPSGDEGDEDAATVEGDLRLERFHFAMSAAWHDPIAPHPHYVPPRPLDLGAWTVACLGYIRSQLEFLDRGRAKR